MELRDRLAASRGETNETVHDLFSEIRDRVHAALVAEIGPQLYDTDLDPSALRRLVVADVRQRLASERSLSLEDRSRLVEEIADDTLGNGPIERLLADESVTEIMVNGPHDVWIERDGRLSQTDVRFADEAHLRRIIARIVGQVGRRIDESSPMVDARLPDGSRVNAVLPPLSLSGPLLTVRKFAKRRMTIDDLVRLGTLTPEAAEFIARCTQAALNILVSGGTGTGKTTLLNAISSVIPDYDRIITIEDAAELQLNQRHVLRLESRPRNIEGEGEIPIRELLRNALRMRPDRIIVGEVRGAEALDMLQAMNTGHDGSLSTVHANSSRDALARVETMVLMAGFDLPMRAVRQQLSSALELIIHIGRMHDGARKVTTITEVQRMESDVIATQDLFEMRADDAGHLALVATGLRPTFLQKFERHGVALPAAGTRAPSVTRAPDPVFTRGGRR